jgi:hypothetical protein
MTAVTWLDRVGNWNPQLLREFRGRLKPRTLTVAIVASVLVQFLLVLFFSQQFPTEACAASRNCWIRDWQTWWVYQFRFITWGIPYVLFLAGVYGLISDLTQEERKGTLNFIRLSPRSSVSILLGKLMGVPILPFISIALLVPLHLVTAVGAGVPWTFVLSYYLILIATGACLFSGAILAAFLSNARLSVGEQSVNAILYAFLTFTVFVPLFFLWNVNTIWSQFGVALTGNRIPPQSLNWFYLPIADNAVIGHVFILLNLFFITLGIWQVLERRFHNPSATILSKQQSYVLSAYMELFVMGFFVYANNDRFSEGNITSLFVLHFFHLIFFSGLIFTLSPNRQSLLDWCRYGALTKLASSTSESETPVPQNTSFASVWRDLIWAEKSPAPVAIAVNILITHAVILIWMFTAWRSPSPSDYERGFFVLGCQICTILIYAVLVQLILLTKTRRPEIWATGGAIALFTLPAIILSILRINPINAPSLWQFLGFPVAVYPYISPTNMTIGFLGQISLILFLSWRLSSKLQSVAKIDG